MDKDINYIQKLAIITLLIITSLGIIVALIIYYNDKKSNFNYQRNFSVTAVGEAKINKSVANISFNIESEGANLKEAMDRKASAYQSLVNFLKLQEISEKDIEITDTVIDIYNRCDNDNNPCSPASHMASDRFLLKIRDIKKTSIILDELIKIGAKKITDPYLSTEEDVLEKAIKKARSQAIAKAQSSAMKIAKEAGITLEKINYITNEYTDTYRGGVETGDDPNIIINENNLLYKVTIGYEFK